MPILFLFFQTTLTEGIWATITIHNIETNGVHLFFARFFIIVKSIVNENISWANILSIEEGSEGIMLVKESHKCVNQYGVDTGEFLWNENGVLSTGTSLLPEEISSDKFKWFWGSWTVIYDNGDEGRELALKQYDRYRYPLNIERDMYTVMCTWGHSKDGRDGRNYATEREVLKELDYVVETGIDMLLIDDGWHRVWKTRWRCLMVASVGGDLIHPHILMVGKILLKK